ncbi:unnamed protein product [Linum tenue]|uniref:Uncharacterized protein n=1 Tax=Linum tenue TaxID=586396 RepID=A0AAV0HU41_9ROSI|nr:unnamed protein product [Linum tenue]
MGEISPAGNPPEGLAMADSSLTS